MRRSQIDVLLVDGTQLVWRARTDAGLSALVAGALQATQARQRAAALGLSDQQLAELLTPARLGERILARGDPGRATTEWAALAMLVLLFMAITVYGAQVLTGVVEEKSTRVVEVLLARVRPWQLLGGKILGIGLLALGQLLLVTVAASVTATMVDAVDIPRLQPGLVAWLLAWFVVGFALWAVVYGALGALAGRSEDSQAVSAPATVVLTASYLFALFSALDDPDALTTRIASFIPMTSPLVMPIRLARGEVAPWEAPLALVLAVATIYGLVRLGGRIYADALLRTAARRACATPGGSAPPACPRIPSLPHPHKPRRAKVSMPPASSAMPKRGRTRHAPAYLTDSLSEATGADGPPRPSRGELERLAILESRLDRELAARYSRASPRRPAHPFGIPGHRVADRPSGTGTLRPSRYVPPPPI